MRKIIDEEKLYIKIMKDGFSRDNHPVFQELLVVAKKIRLENNYGEKNLVKALAEFCLERNENFNLTLSESSLIDVSRAAIRNPKFRSPKFPIYIYSNEIEKINSVKDLKLQMLFLSSVVYARSSGNPSIFSDTGKDIREIIRLSGERFTVPSFIEATPLAKDIGLFHFVKTKYTFYAMIEKPLGDISLTISDLDELESLSEVYRKFNGGYLAWCKLCTNQFLKESLLNTKGQMCQECIEKEDVKEDIK